jgi:hypothetical protein
MMVALTGALNEKRMTNTALNDETGIIVLLLRNV